MKKKANLPMPRADADYEVGYGKPPENTRFKAGKSGNPKGRPRGAKNKRPKLNEERLKGIILDEAYRDITVRDGNRNVTVPMAQAIVRAMAVNAAKGQHRSQRLFAELLSATESQNRQLSDEWVQTAIAYKVEWDKELQRRKDHGITHLPDPLPHPDQVRIDFKTGEARIQGPMCKEDVAELEKWQDQRAMWQEELDEINKDLETERDEGIRELLLDEKAHAKKMLALLDRLLEAIGY
ncbi:DUF5681 domain-containing protein [Marimonas arenosa]|uniref:DUF5681 domain-containing protein n=1 Tax=Marimonas arenosa TaxID=1795305 RepID=A0AAE3WG80_9RHOB|nr:DUF5681 domain-containing protein [Marimonas arenosa]MDQ2092441.1 DUF5681 domain-containing protein [Marimonas arenosa]